MSNRNKRKKDFDPNKSDSDDLDYGAEASPRSRPSGRSKKPKGERKPLKRRRETYNDSDGDIISEEAASSDEGSFAGTSQEEDDEPVERNPITGRGVRSAAKRSVNYGEDSSDAQSGIEDTDLEDPQPSKSRGRSTASNKRQSLIIKLRVPPKSNNPRAARSRPGSSRGVKREPTPQTGSGAGTRRSSRISHDDQQPLVALTDSGNNQVVTRAGTATPEPQAPRPTRGGKGLRSANLPSAIMEASQETSQHTSQAPDFMSQLHEAAASQNAIEEVGDTQPDPTPNDDPDPIQMEVDDEQIVRESADENEEDEGPVARGNRLLRPRRKASTPPTSQPPRNSRRSLRARKSAFEQSSDFEPDAEAEGDVEDDSMTSDTNIKGQDRSSNGGSQGGRRGGKFGRKTASQRSRSARQPSEDELDPDELADEAAELDEDNRRNRRGKRRPAPRTEIAFEPNLRQRGKKVDYRIIRPDLLPPLEDDDAAMPSVVTPARNRRGGGGAAYRSLFSTFGPFGGAGGPPPVFGGEGALATGGVDSDSSDDETGGRGGQPSLGGMVGMTPTSAFPKQFGAGAMNAEPLQGQGGGPVGLGKIKDRKALADADPLGVDPTVSFDGVGGLDDHIDRLKEMVALPLLYPELFTRFKVTPPRGVLFHGPPGTGKTLLARALASSVSSHGQKVTFYMRKGADALSKWVGEAEKQLRLLFEEARKNQPSIIFFDEIDGLAPVRSSKQEQIHASIVATLLALMDGMDGRGQVIVIGATNRPDSVDPALRRPGRFDREFYFPLPDQNARRAIIDIHTKNWEPPLQIPFKDQLAEITRGYGGADLRALCTEAALNAVQGTYPQIYSSNKKLLIDPSTIKVLAKDFMISVNKIVPSSERSASSGAAPLRKDIEPLLRKALTEVTARLDQAIPRKKKTTALEEAMYDDREDEKGFERETMHRQFEASRVFRPRLLIKGHTGMGQNYVGAALLSKLEGLHVQHFDLPTLMKDSTRSTEAAIVQQFEEVKRHKPAVIFIPNIDLWYHTLGDAAIRTFTGLLRSLPPTEPVLLLGIMDRLPNDEDELDRKMLRDLFGYSQKNLFDIVIPDMNARLEYFQSIVDLVQTAPSDFPEPESRKKRILPELPVVEAEEAPSGPSKIQLKAQKKTDRQTLNLLKLHIQSVMDQIKLKYKKFRTPAVDESIIGYLFDEQDPHILTTDLGEEQRQQQQLFRPYELDKDEKGVAGLREVASGKFFYNLEIVTIEKRLSNGYYKRPKDFLADIKRLAKDSKAMGDQDRTIKANEMLANVEVDISSLETQQPAFVAECEAVYEREQQRERELEKKLQEAKHQGQNVAPGSSNVPPPDSSKGTTETSGPVVLGQQIPGSALFPLAVNTAHDAGTGTNSWSHTNGSLISHATNGSHVPSRPTEDIEMPDSQGDEPEPAQPSHAQTWSSTAGPSQPTTLRSQRSALTHLAWGSQPEQYQNSASTTTSGQKTSDKSARSSDLYSLNSNGVRHDGPFSDLAPATGGSQMPDTQPPEASSQSQASPSSQTMAPPAAPAQRKPSVQALLNGPADDVEDSASKAPARIIIDRNDLNTLHHGLAEKASGMSVEQLEQIHAVLMDVIWKRRGEWNRDKVIQAVQSAYNETIEDILMTQGHIDPSQR